MPPRPSTDPPPSSPIVRAILRATSDPARGLSWRSWCGVVGAVALAVGATIQQGGAWWQVVLSAIGAAGLAIGGRSIVRDR